MAHFAEVNENNIVLRVLVTDNDDPNGDEGYQWLISNFGGKWVKTSYNSNIRKKYAGIGDTYDEESDVFLPQRPFSSWTFDE
jgi:L-fucose isomerase-like protein